MANEKNLKPIQSENEAREKGAKGGISSGQARRRKKLLRECLEILLEENRFTETSGAEAIATKLFMAALDGNIKAFEIIRDTVGEKPSSKIIVSDIDPEVIAEIERMVNESAE